MLVWRGGGSLESDRPHSCPRTHGDALFTAPVEFKEELSLKNISVSGRWGGAAMVCLAGLTLQSVKSNASREPFGPDDALSMTPVLEVAGQPNGDGVAIVIARSGDASRIRAYQPAGMLNLATASSKTKFDKYTQAYSAVWSPNGRKVAFFDGFGAERKLLVLNYPAAGAKPLSISLPGEYSRPSALFFQPIWLPDSRALIVAVAEFHNVKIPTDKPYSVSESTKELDSDFDFRDDTLWRLVQVDATTGQQKGLTKPLALRSWKVSPTQDLVFLRVEEKSDPGHFEGDTYVRKASYFLLVPETASLKPIDVGTMTAPRWDLSGDLLFVRDHALMRYGIKSDAVTQVFSQSSVSNAQYEIAGDLIAYWGAVGAASDADYLFSPPSSDRLSLEASNGDSKTVISERENKEIIEALWLPGSKALAIHLRDLNSLDEAIEIYDPHSGRSRTALSGPWSIRAMKPAKSGNELIVQTETATGVERVISVAADTGKIAEIISIDDSVGHPSFVNPILLKFNDQSGHPRRALLFLPKDHKAGDPTPLVVTAYSRLSDEANVFQYEAQMHVARGYVYLMPDVFTYRKHMDAAFLETIPAAIQAARDNAGISGRVGFYGGSLGGFAGLTLLSKSQILQAAVLRAAPTEFSLSWATGKDRDADLLEFLMDGKTPYSDKALYDENSPFWFAPRITAPLLLLQGDLDMQVPIAQGQWMFQAMRRLGKTVEFRTYPGADHSIIRANHDYYVDYYEQMFRWWSLYLKSNAKTQ
jgi:dipeptidyl aminopeptidase/acylaminoacyl peptidase